MVGIDVGIARGALEYVRSRLNIKGLDLNIGVRRRYEVKIVAGSIKADPGTEDGMRNLEPAQECFKK